MYEHLFSSMKIGNVEIPNRTVMTAMGNHIAELGGFVSDADIAFYGARAKGGTGLIITECVAVDGSTGIGNMKQMWADDDKFIPGLKRLADEVHKYGSKIAIQLYHPGRQGIAAVNGVESMKSPSATECQCVHQPTHEMTKDEIKQMVGKFISAAKRVKEAGCDIVEFHGAHGYLIGQFDSPYTNKRTDEYGGSFENRMRFLDEIIDGTRAELGPDYPIMVRISVNEHMDYAGLPGEGLKAEDGVEIAKHLAAKGIDAINVSAGIYETMNTSWEPVSFDQGWKLGDAAAVKKAVDIPVIATAVFREPAYADKAIADGLIDFMGSARAFNADPEWANKAKEGRDADIRKCISCLYCMETLMSADFPDKPDFGCAINYESGKEWKCNAEELPKDGAGRKVAVIGAGPSGMEAARVLALRGFAPVVFEKNDKVGGQINYACKPPKKEKTGWLKEWQEHALRSAGVEIRTGKAPTMEDIRAIEPYAVFVAQGSSPVMPRSIKGLDGENVYTPVDVLSGKVSFENKKLCVVGSGMTGIETAELLGEAGNKISVYEMMDDIGPGLFFQNLIDVMTRVSKMDIALFPKHMLKEIDGTTAIFETTDTHEIVQDTFDAVIVSLGVRPNADLVEELKAEFDKVVLMGDAVKGGRIAAAIGTGYMAAAELK